MMFSFHGSLELMVRARGYRGRFVRPGLSFLLIVGAALSVAWFAGFRFEVATALPSALLFLPHAALVSALFYFSAEMTYRETWGGPEREQIAAEELESSRAQDGAVRSEYVA
jgi:hypothetical protein